jgi:DNA-binding HxlR family transcriptional regulator
MADTPYRQFCPVAKGAEIVATRWTPLILLQLMLGENSFSNIHRGIPLMSRSLLSERLRQLEADGIIRRVGPDSEEAKSSNWQLTPAGIALRDVIDAMGRWGLTFGRHRLTNDDYDPSVLLWALQRRADATAITSGRHVLRFEFSGVSGSRTGLRLGWLVFTPGSIDACLKDPGQPVDTTLSVPIGVMIRLYLGDIDWKTALAEGMRLHGPSTLTAPLPRWLRLDRRLGYDLPLLPDSIPVPNKQAAE